METPQPLFADDRPMPAGGRVGVWIVGARGSVAVTAQVGAAALAASLVPPVGLVTELAAFAETSLVSFDALLFGGHDIGNTPVAKRAEGLAHDGVFSLDVLRAVQDKLIDNEQRIRPGFEANVGESPIEAVHRLAADIKEFTATNQLAQTIVVNLSSVERPIDAALLQSDLDTILQAPDAPASVVYAAAAIEAKSAYVDFTPSMAMRCPAVWNFAQQAGLPLAGRDGKTGETLVKSALAPMFASRNLRVRSWSGTNLLGGGDGATLANPEVAASKLSSKGEVLTSVLGYEVDAPLHIDYIADSGEWKTAWDHIGFEGFLGSRMTLQFTWHGCDSALAAPLVLDLVRLTALARQRNQAGVVDQLAFFFKDPVGGDTHVLGEQFQQLQQWVLDS